MFGLPAWIMVWLIFYWANVIGSWILSLSGTLIDNNKKRDKR